MKVGKTKRKRYSVSLSIETIIALKEVMADHLKSEPESKWTKDYTKTIKNLNKAIEKHNAMEAENGHEPKDKE